MLEIHSVEKKDYADLARFLSNFENEIKKEIFWLGRFSFWWDQNPAFTEDMKRGWILKNGDTIEGFAGNIPTFFKLAEKIIIVSNGTTWRVNKKFRGSLSLELLLRLMDNAKDTIYFDTSSSGRIAEIKRRLGFTNIFKNKFKSFYFFINPESIFNKKSSSLFTLKCVFMLLYPIFKLYHLAVKVFVKRLKEYYQVKIINNADDSFDSLWQATKSRFKNTNLRTAKVIDWYCSNNGENKNVVLCAYINNQLKGYLVCTGEGREEKVKKLTIMDIWGAKEDSKLIASLISKSFKYAVENGYEMMLLPCFTPDLYPFFKNFIYYTYAGDNFFIKAKPDILDALKSNSYFVYMQGDRGLF